MLSTRKGQSIIEYATMAALITVGVLVMGPYVVRSINALFKSIEEDVNDSLNEDIHQASPGYSLPECTCGELIDQECGGWTCNDYQMYRKRTCNPTGCEILFLQARNVKIQMDDCEYRDNCCDKWKETGLCGAQAAASYPGNPPEGFPGIPVDGCPDREMLFYHDCGETKIREYACQSTCIHDPKDPCPADPYAQCIFYCHMPGLPDTPVGGSPPTFPQPNPDRATWCPGAATGLVGKTAVTFVGACTGAKCEATCAPPFTLH